MKLSSALGRFLLNAIQWVGWGACPLSTAVYCPAVQVDEWDGLDVSTVHCPANWEGVSEELPVDSLVLNNTPSLFSTWLENGAAPILNFHSLKAKSRLIKVWEIILSSFSFYKDPAYNSTNPQITATWLKSI